MKSLSVVNLPDSTYIDMPVFLDKGYILLSPDIPFTTNLKERLEKWKYEEIFTDGIQADSPPPEEETGARFGNLEEDIHEVEQVEETRKFYAETVNNLDDVFTRFLNRSELRISELTDIVKELIAYLRSHKRFILSLPFAEESGADYLPSTCVKTALLSLAIGDFLKLPPHKLIELGLSGILHKVGMLKIPKTIWLSENTLSDQEKKTIFAHPVIGFKVLRTYSFPMPVCLAVLEHAEKVDGSGYPRKLTGDKISLYGKIVSVACAYNGAVSKRPWKNEIDGHTGIMDMLKEIGRHYDERILRALVYTLSIYPLGTYVELSNNAKGVVVRNDSENPKYPTIRLLVNEKGTPFAETPLLQTKEGDEITISKALTKSEVEKLKAIIGRSR